MQPLGKAAPQPILSCCPGLALEPNPPASNDKTGGPTLFSAASASWSQPGQTSGPTAGPKGPSSAGLPHSALAFASGVGSTHCDDSPSFPSCRETARNHRMCVLGAAEDEWWLTGDNSLAGKVCG